QLGRILLHHDATLEVEAGAEAEVLVARTRVAVVRREAGGEEGAGGGLDVHHVGDGAGLHRDDGLGVEVHLAAVERTDLAPDRRAARGEEADAVDEAARETNAAGLAGTNLQLESESECRGVPLHAR